jgi:hypothetical protein
MKHSSTLYVGLGVQESIAVAYVSDAKREERVPWC